MKRNLSSPPLRRLLLALATGCVLFAAAPPAQSVTVDLVDPNELAEDKDGCRTKGWRGGAGHISVAGEGTFSIVGDWVNGCGGRGCDDAVSGTVYRNEQRYGSFAVQESPDRDGWCTAVCTYRGKDWALYDARVSPSGDGVSFHCGNVFSGWLDWGVPQSIVQEVAEDLTVNLVDELTRDILA